MNSDFNDEDLDLLFRTKAQNGGEEPEFEAEAWVAMERLLDKRRRRIILYYASAAIIFIGSLGFGWLFYFSQQEQIQFPKKELANTIDNTKKETLKPEQNGNNQTQKSIDLIISKSSKPNKHFEKAAESLKSKLDIRNISSEKTEEFASTLTSEIVLNTSETINHESVLKPVLSYPVAGLTSENDDDNQLHPKKMVWNLGLVIGPELNTLGGGSQSGKNLNTGIYLSGSIKKLGFYFGANYGIKTYAASNTQYQNINPRFINSITNINASCDILEVPIGISYQLLDFKKSSIQLNSGLSSYFMLKEKYTYQYNLTSGIADREITRINRNQHYFKVLNLAATYNFRLNKTLPNVGISPYVKLPLAGVGEGEVKLRSYGINFHFNYQINKN